MDESRSRCALDVHADEHAGAMIMCMTSYEVTAPCCDEKGRRVSRQPPILTREFHGGFRDG